jgi:ArsR family transcriptional regulator
MKLLEIYRCLGDETRLRILHLLAQGPLCVCHFQAILGAPQVAISKHLAYLRQHDEWMIYHLPEPCPDELRVQLQCLRDCAKCYAVLRRDLKRLKNIQGECGWIVETARGVARPTRSKLCK